MSKPKVDHAAVSAIEERIDKILAASSKKGAMLGPILDDVIEMIHQVPETVLPPRDRSYIIKNIKDLKQREGNKPLNLLSRLMIKKSLNSLKKQLKV